MKLVLYIAKFYSIPIFKPLVDYLNTRSADYRFYVSDKVRNNFPVDWKKDLIIKDIREAKEFNPDFVLSSGNYVDFRIPGIKVQIFHGIGVEKPAHYKIRHFFDLYLTSGPFVTEKFLKLREKYDRYFEVRETGWLKIDYILSYQTENLKERYNIPENKTIVLYAPTFSNQMESGSAMITQLEQMIKQDEIWLLKFHEFMDKATLGLFKKLQNPAIRILDTYDISPYLHLADIMISDTSSVIYEFMALNKPVITINTLSRKDKGIDVSNIADVRTKIDLLRENPEMLKKNIERHLAEVNPYLDGKTAERTILALEQISNLGILPRKNKPFNLFRKIYLVYNYVIRRGYFK